MTIRSARHPKVKKWKELYAGDDRDSEYFVTDGLRMLGGAAERGLLTELVILEKLRPCGLFEDMDRTWISDEVAAEIGMNSEFWFAVVKKPKLRIEKFERILLLDNYHHAGTLGTVIRSARSFGFDGILLTGDSVNPWARAVTRSGMYNLLELPILSLPFTDAVRMLREQQALFVTVGKRKAVPVEQMAEFIRFYYYGTGEDGRVSWTDKFFPYINTTERLERLDRLSQECLRYVAVGRRTNAKFRFRYSEIRATGYVPLVRAYYGRREK